MWIFFPIKKYVWSEKDPDPKRCEKSDPIDIICKSDPDPQFTGKLDPDPKLVVSDL